MVSLYARGTKLYIQYTVNGKRKQKSTGLNDTPANRKLLKNKVIPQLEVKIINGDINKKPPTLFKIYADKYLSLKDHIKTIRETISRVEKINKVFGHREVSSIKRAEVREYASVLLKEVSPKTVRNYIGIFKAILEVAIEYDEITDNPAEHIKLPQHIKAEVTPFTPEEVIRLIDASDGWFKNFLAISFYTGMRTGEALGLMYGDIDLTSKTLHIKRSVSKGKTTTPKTTSGVRQVPIFDHLMPYIKEQLAAKKSLYLFTNDEGKPFYGADSLKRHWRSTCEKSGVKYRKLYTTRHTFITSMLKSGVISILELAQTVGHANTEPIIKNYARFIEGEHLKIKRSFSPFDVTVQLTPRSEAL